MINIYHQSFIDKIKNFFLLVVKTNLSTTKMIDLNYLILQSHRFLLLILLIFQILSPLYTIHLMLLFSYRSENISNLPDSSCIIKSCLHFYSSFYLLIISFVASINSISSLTMFFLNKISNFLISSSNFYISSYS